MRISFSSIKRPWNEVWAGSHCWWRHLYTNWTFSFSFCFSQNVSLPNTFPYSPLFFFIHFFIFIPNFKSTPSDFLTNSTPHLLDRYHHPSNSLLMVPNATTTSVDQLKGPIPERPPLQLKLTIPTRPNFHPTSPESEYNYFFSFYFISILFVKVSQVSYNWKNCLKLGKYIHTLSHTHKRIHTHTQVHTHTQTHTRSHTLKHWNTHTHTHTRAHTHILPWIHMHTHSHVHEVFWTPAYFMPVSFVLLFQPTPITNFDNFVRHFYMFQSVYLWY